MYSEWTSESKGAAPLPAGQPLGPAAAWEPFVLAFRTRKLHDWWEFSVRVLFQHAESGEALELEGRWNGAGTIWFASRWAGRAGGDMPRGP